MSIKSSSRRHVIAALMGVSILPLSILAPAVSAQVVVYDPTNYAQNLLQAARALQQINNQIQSLQNEANMLQNMARQLQRLDFSSLSQITGSMQRISTLMNQAQGIAFSLSSTEAALRQQFPLSFDAATTNSTIVQQALAQWQAAMQGYQQAMRVQSQVVENVQSDGDLLAELVTQSQGADGGLQAQQAANQLTALSVKQQLQIQNLMAAQYRADALERARQADALEAARVTSKRFLGSADIYNAH